MNYAFRGIICLLLGQFIFGCAKLEYVKVPSPTQYMNWTDEDQRRADTMEGVRYYLPRPFLHLKQSLPVAQRVAFVSLKKNANNTAYTVELPVDAPTWLRRALPKEISSQQVLMALQARKGEEKDGPSLQSGTEEDKAEKKTPPSTAEPPPSELTARTGYISDTDSVTRLDDRMDVVYLPDFEEQFVIHANTGIGKADIETKLRNGWAAEVFSQQVTNQNLIPFVVRQVQQASAAMAGIFTTWAPLAMGLPSEVTPLPKTVQLQSGKESPLTNIEETLGSVVIMKVAEVKVAQPGLYPILKPREIRQWFGKGGVALDADPDGNFEFYLKHADLPWIRPDMVFIPVPPFTVIGFNITTDMFISPATGHVEMETTKDTPPKIHQPASLQGIEKLKNHLNDKLLSQRGFKADVKVERDALVVSVVVPGPAPSSFTTNERNKLDNDIRESIKSILGDLGSLNRIELPVSRDALYRLQKSLALKLNGWSIEISLESTLKNVCRLKKIDSSAVTTVNAKNVVAQEWENMLRDEKAGDRELDILVQ